MDDEKVKKIDREIVIPIFISICTSVFTTILVRYLMLKK